MSHTFSPYQAPLYKELKEQPVASSEGRLTGISGPYHKGLWFERFFNQYDAGWSVPAKGKSQWIKAVEGSCGDDVQMEQANHRRIKLIRSLGGEFGIFNLDWHFVTGMGNAHPVENGFSWHPTLGTPWIPGSTVKGLVRAWVERELIPTGHCDKKLVYMFFGSESKNPDECEEDNRAGALLFFDAIPVNKVQLTTDIMTPHYGKWYEQGGSEQAGRQILCPATGTARYRFPFLSAKRRVSFLALLLVRVVLLRLSCSIRPCHG